MNHLISRNASIVRRVAMMLAIVCVISSVASFGRAADLAEQAHSLRKVPADASFYSASLRLKEQWEVFRGSKAYSKIMEIPLVQLGKMQAGFYWQQSNEPHIAQIRKYLHSSAGKEALAVAGEMFSEEVFAYGGSNIAESITLFMEMNTVARAARLQAIADGESPEEAATKKVLDQFKDKLANGLAVPTFVMGFRVKDGERAKHELDEVHSLLSKLFEANVPEIAGHLQRDKIAGNEFLTLRLDGSMIPWDKLREQSEDLEDEEFDSIRDTISKQTLVVALGVADEFVLLSVGESTDHLSKLGEGSTLVDQPAIKRLQEHADQKAVSLTYLSKALAESFGSAQRTIDEVAGSAEEVMVQLKLDEEDRKLLLEDIRAFDLARYMPEPGEISMIGYLTKRGYEAFQYNTGKRPMLDSSQPLTILKHVGGSPSLLFAARSKENAEDYAQVVDWLKRVAGHAEQIAEKKADADDWDKYKEFRGRGIALLKQLDKATRKNLIPALADGQSALVLDLSATSTQWFNKMPEALTPLPIPELALVVSVSDAEKLRESVATYVEVVQEGYKLVREANTEEMPEIELPTAKVSELSGGGKLYKFPLPEEWGVDDQIAPNAGLTDTTAAISVMPKTTERLLAETASTIDTSLPLDRPAATITHIEIAKGIAATRPWITYGLDIASGKIKQPKVKAEESDEEEQEEDEEEPPREPPSAMMIQMGLIVPQVEQLLDVAMAIRSATSVTYEDNGVWVTHSETHLEDLK